MLKILMITSGLECGITRYTKELISEMSKIQMKISCIQIKQGIFRINILKDIIRLKPDIIHIQYEIVMFDRLLGVTSFFIYLYAFITRIKTVTTFHTVKSLRNFENEIADKYRKPLLTSIAKQFIKFSFKIISLLSDKIIVLTKSAKNVLEKEYKIKNATYIFHGFFHPIKVNEVELRRFREYLGIRSRDKVILLFGYPFEFKGYHYVIKSMPIILKKHPDTKLVITGGISLADPTQCKNYLFKLKKMTEDLRLNSKVIFTEYIPDEKVPYLITMSDLVIFPYKAHNSASGSISTVYPYKKPIIVSDIPIFDAFKNGKDCIKVNVDKEEELGKAIDLIFRDSETSSKLCENIDRKMRELSISNASKDHLTVYKSIL